MGKQRRNPVTDAQILETYQQTRSAYQTAELLGIGDTTVYRVLTREGVDRTGLADYRSRITRFKGMEQQIKSWYDAGETLDVIRTRLNGASDYAIKHAIRRAGGEFRLNPAPTLKPGELEQIRELRAQGLGQLDISLALNRSQSFISRAMMRAGIPTKGNRGAAHNSWKGGRVIVQGGYVRVYVEPIDPFVAMANNTGHVLEHRLVMARSLGRPLSKTETVHHINGDHADNRPENLQLRHGRHGKHHAMRCLDCGSHNIGPAPLADQEIPS